MKAFADLLDGLVHTPGREAKLRRLTAYFRDTPDPDRGYALAALTGNLTLKTAKPAMIRALVADRVDPVLFGWSYDYVGDLAETCALIWPTRAADAQTPRLAAVVERLQAAHRAEVPRLIEGWMDSLDAGPRYALMKLVTGGLRVGVSSGLAKAALARLGPVPPEEIEEVWHALSPPYEALFAYAEGRGPRPDTTEKLTFRAPMLAHPIDEADFAALDPAAFRAEWKWDGIRVQLVMRGHEVRMFSRTGEDVGPAFPDLLDTLKGDATLDGELLVGDGLSPTGFADLQQRLNRKTVDRALMQRYPAFVRVYDMLFEGEEDLRPLPFDARRDRLADWVGRTALPHIDLSPQIAFSSWDDLVGHRLTSGNAAAEGLMLKRGDSPYVAGRPKGLWYKWKRDPHLVDAVLMYAQRGHGKRSSFYSDFTFGVWADDDALVPVGKAYFGFTDAELVELDKWVRNHTVKRFGPVREVAQGLVLEIAFEGLQRSNRHKSGVAMRFPRINRIRWDKPPAEADRLEGLSRLLPPP